MCVCVCLIICETNSNFSSLQPCCLRQLQASKVVPLIYNGYLPKGTVHSPPSFLFLLPAIHQSRLFWCEVQSFGDFHLLSNVIELGGSWLVAPTNISLSGNVSFQKSWPSYSRLFHVVSGRSYFLCVSQRRRKCAPTHGQSGAILGFGILLKNTSTPLMFTSGAVTCMKLLTRRSVDGLM